MVRKLKELAEADQNALVDAVCGSAHRIWQAGLGAFAKAQQEGGELFDKLVDDGVELQKLTQRISADKGFSVADTVTRLAENASRQASGSWDKLEKVFEERVGRSLRSLGVPSQQELSTLSQDMAELKAALRMVGERAQDEIGALSRAVADLKAALPGPARKPVAKKPAAKVAAKPAAKATRKSATKAAAKPASKAAKAPAKAAPRRVPAKSVAAKRTSRAAAH
jgi:poly(hydroxyalkanoate) granule-associated protein